MFTKMIKGLFSNDAQEVLELDELVKYAKSVQKTHKQAQSYLLQQDKADDGYIVNLVFVDGNNEPITRGKSYLGRTFYAQSLSEELSEMLKEESLQPIL